MDTKKKVFGIEVRSGFTCDGQLAAGIDRVLRSRKSRLRVL